MTIVSIKIESEPTISKELLDFLQSQVAAQKITITNMFVGHTRQVATILIQGATDNEKMAEKEFLIGEIHRRNFQCKIQTPHVVIS